MGHVAAAAAGNTDFVEASGAPLKDGHASARRGFRAGNGGKDPRRAAADNDDPLRTHAAKLHKGPDDAKRSRDIAIVRAAFPAVTDEAVPNPAPASTPHKR